MTYISLSWQSVTPIRKLLSKSKRLRNPTVTAAKICSNPKTSSGSYAKPKIDSTQSRLIHRASRLSSSAEKFSTRRLARSAFFSVSVTRYAFLPCGFLPAPLRFPPQFNFFSMLKISLTILIYYI